MFIKQSHPHIVLSYEVWQCLCCVCDLFSMRQPRKSIWIPLYNAEVQTDTEKAHVRIVLADCAMQRRSESDFFFFFAQEAEIPKI